MEKKTSLIDTLVCYSDIYDSGGFVQRSRIETVTYGGSKITFHSKLRKCDHNSAWFFFSIGPKTVRKVCLNGNTTPL